MSIIRGSYSFLMRAKFVLIIPVVALLATLFIGLWSYKGIKESIYSRSYENLSVLLQDTVDDELGYRAALLKKSHMDRVDFFVREYQEDSLKSIAVKSGKHASRFLVFDSSGKILLGEETAGRLASESGLEGAIAALREQSRAVSYGQLQGEGDYFLYTAAHFQPWGWSIFLLEPEGYTLLEVRKIFWRTFLGISAIMILVVVTILLVLKRFIFNRITLLKGAADQISRKEWMERIDISTPDDFGDLARSMEHMSGELQQHQQRQQQLLREGAALNSELLFANARLSQLQADMDQQIKERTTTLETIQRELYENLQAMEMELKSAKAKNHELVRKLSELTLKQSDMVNSHSEVVRNLRVKHDRLMEARSELQPQKG